MTDFYFVRHGQTAANAAGLKQGCINTPITYLSEKGKQQAQTLHDHFDISFADRIISSPLKRTQDTAAYLNQTAKLPISLDKRVLEISYGNWDGKKNADLQKAHPEVFDPVLNDVLPSYATLAKGETFDGVIERVNDFMLDVNKQSPDEKIIVVTHGFTIKAAVLAAMGNPIDVMVIQEPDNTTVTKITLANNNYYVKYFNRSANAAF
ncbi:histidine phosphatase family protein [Lactobacillus sp. Sy-1]|uniref:histidine phosphatase family protein n=1 Tax=Lactobacillus sp. Sy-1 TaxID=2109645 RepID=UPI001C577B89|nr:histidine phosphatase family protein [Lactobacillus sp. Sy-1]MBW1604964.1 histidine phosphatase family protein [Lactobacillus sp. Sy-1]